MWKRVAWVVRICPTSSPLVLPRALAWTSTRTRSPWSSRYSSTSARTSSQALRKAREYSTMPAIPIELEGWGPSASELDLRVRPHRRALVTLLPGRVDRAHEVQVRVHELPLHPRSFEGLLPGEVRELANDLPAPQVMDGRGALAELSTLDGGVDAGQPDDATVIYVDHSLKPPLLPLEDLPESGKECSQGLTTPVHAILRPLRRRHVFDIRTVEVEPAVLLAIERSVHLTHDLHVSSSYVKHLPEIAESSDIAAG